MRQLSTGEVRTLNSLIQHAQDRLPVEAILPLLAALQSTTAELGHEQLHATCELILRQSDDPHQFYSSLLSLQQFCTASAQSLSSALSQDLEIVSEFVVEAREHLAQVETQLLLLEEDSNNPEAVKLCFRAFHTIKGVAGFLELTTLQSVCHEVESLLDKARSGSVEVDSAIVDVLLEAGDFVSREIDEVERAANEGVTPSARSPEALLVKLAVFLNAPCELLGEQTSSAVANDIDTPDFEEQLDSAPVSRSKALTPEGAERGKRLLKVDTAKLDHLVEIVGELVVAQSLVRNDSQTAERDNPALSRKLAQLGRITNELQKATMGMRMVPIGQLFHKMTRLVRDLSRKSGKPTEVVLSGEDIELDRNIVEELADPLMHMVRNSLDHGVEDPEARRKAGKPVPAVLRLSAAHKAGQIVVEVADDGRGLDSARILDKAIRRGLLPPGATPPESEIFPLIFESGLSTAEKVTDISGRGVGMDVVKKQIHKLRGRIEIASQAGHGTTFTLRLPLTLAIIEGLVIQVGRDRFLLPIASVREVIKPLPGMISTIESGSEIALLRDRLYPVLRLHERFAIEPKSKDLVDGLLVVIESSDRTYCLAVDELLGKQEVVIKSLGQIFGRVSGLAGGAILADGKVGLLIDPENLLRRSNDVDLGR